MTLYIMNEVNLYTLIIILGRNKQIYFFILAKSVEKVSFYLIVSIKYHVIFMYIYK